MRDCRRLSSSDRPSSWVFCSSRRFLPCLPADFSPRHLRMEPTPDAGRYSGGGKLWLENVELLIFKFHSSQTTNHGKIQTDQQFLTLRASQAPSDDPTPVDSLKPSSSSSELSLPFPLKQLQRLRAHLAAGCFSLPSSMKFCTIFAKQTELGSNSPSLLFPGSPMPGFSVAEVILRTLGNGRSKSLLSRDFEAGLAESARNGSRCNWVSTPTGWIFIGGMSGRLIATLYFAVFRTPGS